MMVDGNVSRSRKSDKNGVSLAILRQVAEDKDFRRTIRCGWVP
ncbi:hypothetical protein QP185_01930 [Sphingomonas aerolata]